MNTINFLSSPLANGLVNKTNDKQKELGTVGNRVDCNNAKIKQALKDGVKDTFVASGVAAATVGATVATAKSKTAQNALISGFSKIKDTKAIKHITDTLRQT